MFQPMTQTEAKQYEEGRRDGYNGDHMQQSESAAYRAGYREGLADYRLGLLESIGE